MRKLVSFMHMTLDGFAAGPKGEINWAQVDEEMFEQAGRQTAESDTALYGRVTYELMQAYWPTAADQPQPTRHDIEHSTWYRKVEKVIVSRSMKGQQLPNTTIISDNPGEYIHELKKRPGKDIVMFGSPGISKLMMQLDLIDTFWIFINPIILGQGMPFFGGLNAPLKLKLLSAKSFTSGVVCLHYEREVKRDTR